ncbi:unnamed protein product [Rhodiola kirilowii]
MINLQNDGSDNYSKELHILACKPQCHSCYTHCVVNGLKFVVWEKDQHMKTENSGVMILAGGIKYYGILQNVIELEYAEGMPVMLFHCKWFNTDPVDGNIKMDHRLLSIDTSNTWYDDAPYCLAKHAQQVFYLEGSKLGDNWKVVNVVTRRGPYSHSCISRDETSNVVEEAYQEDGTTNIPSYMSNDLDEDDIEEGLDTPHMIPGSHYDYHNTVDIEEDESEFIDEEDVDDDEDELEYESDHVGSKDEYGSDDGGDEDHDDGFL